MPHLLAACPVDVKDRLYCEPFLGAASLFFSVSPERALLGDANPNLVAFYEKVRDDPKGVAAILAKLKRDLSEQRYYAIRAAYNRNRDSVSQAARFLYLNRTCFNGVFRVNMKGAFNVPYGRKKSPLFPTAEHMKQVSSRLSNAALTVGDFSSFLQEVPRKAFVYLDPPYPALNGTSYFTHYTMSRFSEVDQIRLAAATKNLDSKGVKFLISNADTPMIRRLYADWAFREVPVVRYVTCKKIKHIAREVLITNY